MILYIILPTLGSWYHQQRGCWTEVGWHADADEAKKAEDVSIVAILKPIPLFFTEGIA